VAGADGTNRERWAVRQHPAQNPALTAGFLFPAMIGEPSMAAKTPDELDAALEATAHGAAEQRLSRIAFVATAALIAILREMRAQRK
jgi:hypothetical protein